MALSQTEVAAAEALIGLTFREGNRGKKLTGIRDHGETRTDTRLLRCCTPLHACLILRCRLPLRPLWLLQGGKSPLEMALKAGHHECARILRNHRPRAPAAMLTAGAASVAAVAAPPPPAANSLLAPPPQSSRKNRKPPAAAAESAAAGVAAVEAVAAVSCYHCGGSGEERGAGRMSGEDDALAPPTATAQGSGEVAMKAKLKLCGRCKQVRFCSDECMRLAWPLHKAECRVPEKE